MRYDRYSHESQVIEYVLCINPSGITSQYRLRETYHKTKHNCESTYIALNPNVSLF